MALSICKNCQNNIYCNIASRQSKMNNSDVYTCIACLRDKLNQLLPCLHIKQSNDMSNLYNLLILDSSCFVYLSSEWCNLFCKHIKLAVAFFTYAFTTIYLLCSLGWSYRMCIVYIALQLTDVHERFSTFCNFLCLVTIVGYFYTNFKTLGSTVQWL